MYFLLNHHFLLFYTHWILYKDDETSERYVNKGTFFTTPKLDTNENRRNLKKLYFLIGESNIIKINKHI